jgi:magnesium chelatase subunit D
MLETAMAIAAYDGREEVGAYDIKRAAELVLPHRIRENISPQSEQQQSDLQNDIDENQARDNSEKNDIPQKQSPELDFENIDNNENNISDNNIVDDDIVQGEEIYKPRDVSPMRSDRKARIGSGRRSKTISGTNRGRYIGFNMPKKEIQDIAFDATLRAAAIHQTVRDKGRGAISINKSDIRVKKRENHTGTTIIFAVDASGSMGAKKRMKATKEAILSLLYDAYQKRDNVGMIAFRKDRAEQILPITRSVELAQKKLQRLPTGGRTPLSQGIMLGWKTIMAQRTKDKNMLPLFILITDGRANSEVNGNDPIKEAFRAAELINSSKINSIVIDTEKTPISLGLAKDIADRMGAEYIKVDELKAQGIKNIVSSFS